MRAPKYGQSAYWGVSYRNQPRALWHIPGVAPFVACSWGAQNSDKLLGFRAARALRVPLQERA